jgi:hypothetical protein
MTCCDQHVAATQLVIQTHSGGTGSACCLQHLAAGHKQDRQKSLVAASSSASVMPCAEIMMNGLVCQVGVEPMRGKANSKFQVPRSREDPSIKDQAPNLNVVAEGLVLGSWSFSGVRSLVFGVLTWCPRDLGSYSCCIYRAKIWRMTSSMGTSSMSMSLTGRSSSKALQTGMTRSRLTLSLMLPALCSTSSP